MTRQDVVKKYGAIDFGSKHWPDQSKWMAMLEIPHEWFPNWYVQDSKIPVKHIYCNKDIHGPLLRALESIHTLGLGGQLRTFNGCFNIRPVRNSSSFSLHSYGIAIDVAAKWNPMQMILRTSFSPAFVKCFTQNNFYWGGNFKGRRDPMHFSYGISG